MAYALVKFLDEETFSEVPKTWLEGDENCWWPASTKIVSSFISKMVPPNKIDGKWKLYPVEIVENDCGNIFILCMHREGPHELFNILQIMKKLAKKQITAVVAVQTLKCREKEKGKKN